MGDARSPVVNTRWTAAVEEAVARLFGSWERFDALTLSAHCRFVDDPLAYPVVPGTRTRVVEVRPPDGPSVRLYFDHDGGTLDLTRVECGDRPA